MSALSVASAAAHLGARAFEPRFGLRHVGARDLADVEPVARLAKLLREHVDIASLQIEGGRVPEHVHIGCGAAEEHRFLGVAQALTRGKHEAFGLSNGVRGRARIEDHLVELRPCTAWQQPLILDDRSRLQEGSADSGIWRAEIQGFGADLARCADLRSITGFGLRHAFVGRTHAGALGIQLRIVADRL